MAEQEMNRLILRMVTPVSSSGLSDIQQNHPTVQNVILMPVPLISNSGDHFAHVYLWKIPSTTGLIYNIETKS